MSRVAIREHLRTAPTPADVPSLAKLLRLWQGQEDFPVQLWCDMAERHGTEFAGRLWDSAARQLGEEIAGGVILEMPTYEQLTDLAEAGFIDEQGVSSLPGVYHRPGYMGTSEPSLWVCAVCWTDGIVNGWPCPPLAGDRAASVALARHLGLEWSA